MTKSMNNLKIKEKNLLNSIKRDDVHEKLVHFENILENKRLNKQKVLMEKMNKIDEMK